MSRIYLKAEGVGRSPDTARRVACATLSLAGLVLFATLNSSAQTSLRAVNQLPPQLVGQPMAGFVTSLGTRLKAQGLARTTFAGTLSMPGLPDAPITVVRENPGLIEVVQGAGATRTTSVIDQQSQKATIGVSGMQAKLLETLLFDCADFLLFDQANFGGTRYLGTAYPYPRAEASARFSVFDHPTNIGLLEPGTIRNKRFFFNQATGLLEYVVSLGANASVKTAAETAITWQKSGTEQFPASITHWEMGAEVFAIHFLQASAGPSAADGVFKP